MENAKPRRQIWVDNIKFLLVAGGGLFGDGYLNQTIGLVVPMIGYLYFQDTKNTPSAIQADEIKGSFSVGMIFEQLLFGTLGDALGRQRVYGKECLFAIFGTLLVVLLPWKGLSHQGVVAWLAVFRAVTGMGTGGDYPMTSTLSAEHRIIGSRAKLILLVFAFLALGTLTAAVVYVILLAAFKFGGFLLGLGIIPAVFTLYARLQMKETVPYEKYVAKDTSLKDSTKRGYGTQWRDFSAYFSEWRHAKVLIAVSMAWLLFDIAYYGISLNQSIILKDIGFGAGKSAWETLHNTAVGNVIVSFAGQLPGSWIGVFLPDIFGRRSLLIWSSLLTAVLYAVWAGVNDQASSGGLITLFTLSQLTLNFGPTTMTFLLPVKLFPTRVRGTAHGIAAASGKCGAILTAFAFGTINDTLGLRGALGLFAGVMVLVAGTGLWIPETKGMTLDQIETGVLYGDVIEEDGAISSDSSINKSDQKGLNSGVQVQSVQMSV
ncbi:putative inorganic phosphate transporter C8E4.01c [Xylogone sp. PMI_703]|nr:putative inorganic phosphate transporter C8E4.01c [Xylogone sp. PMI_703]